MSFAVSALRTIQKECAANSWRAEWHLLTGLRWGYGDGSAGDSLLNALFEDTRNPDAGHSSTSQITQTVRTGDAYAWAGHGNGSTAYTQNGLNQQVTVGGSTATWDSKGNLTGGLR